MDAFTNPEVSKITAAIPTAMPAGIRKLQPLGSNGADGKLEESVQRMSVLHQGLHRVELGSTTMPVKRK